MSPSTAHDHVGEEPCFTAIIDGLTKRELFAAMAMQGSLASGDWSKELLELRMKGGSDRLIALLAIDVADALIAELAK